MKFVGNYKDWIKNEWIEYLLTTEGARRPGHAPIPDVEEFKKGPEAGYDLTSTYWHSYDRTNCELNITCPFNPDQEIEWWFIKMYPGNFIPMHRDIFSTDNSPLRYWMPLQDYADGHVFLYKDEFLKDYRAGDLWIYENSDEIHGACNIGYSTRLTFQFTTYDTIR